MGSETIVAVSGLIGLGAAVFTGALWDSPPVSALLRLRENLRSQAGTQCQLRLGRARPRRSRLEYPALLTSASPTNPRQ